jgi:sterol desaturase/sphingolipid hydroxylase (fatty acid hydroxylase superfamily)
VKRPGGQAIAGVAIAALAIGLFVIERKRPLRRAQEAEPQRIARNFAIGGLSLATASLLQRPLIGPLTELAERRGWGLARQLPVPAWARDAVAFLILDYTMYLWHVLTHRAPLLWRFHLVHHVDRDLDTSTALRFHIADMALSVPWRAGQVIVAGASPRLLRVWQSFFFASTLFHHSNVRLPIGLERALTLLLVTPGQHGIHHSDVEAHTGSNWSSGLNLWDRLHGTLRTDVPAELIRIGVPAYAQAEDVTLGRSLALPFTHDRESWVTRL